tara:strand:- start:249 stop:2171 length:1923 start_codon:yes stop_codon:yes gene_type:complete
MPKYELIEPVLITTDELLEAYTLEDNPKIFDRVDNIIIELNGKHIQLGEICYLNFEKKHNKLNKKFKQLYVVPSSINLVRVQTTKILLKHINDLLIEGIRPVTINNRVKTIINFLAYLNINNIEFILERQSIQSALAHFSQYLKHQIKIHNKEKRVGLTTGTAHNYQKWVLSFTSFILSIDSLELLSSSDLIKTNDAQRIQTEPLSNETLSLEFNQYTTIFRRFSSIILNNEPFPILFELGIERYWITQTGKVIHKDSEILKRSGVFNFKEGREYTLDEIITSKRYKNTSNRNEAIKIFHKNKDKENIQTSESRLLLIFSACKAYFMHFLFLTGENDSTAASILFNDDYSITNSDKHFKSIKWRANGQTVKYDIQSEFIEDFQIYIRLRNFLLKHYNEKHNQLFLNLLHGQLVAAPNNGSHSSIIRTQSSSLFKENNFIATSKTIRVTKSLWVRKHYGSSLSSYILQHSNKTSNSNYTGITPEETDEELAIYYSELTNQLLDAPGIEKSTASGNCVDPNMPQPISIPLFNDKLTVDCSDQKSCLFCDKYKLHTDEEDIRKLLSLKYIIAQSEHLSASSEHFNRVYKLLLVRIEKLLDQIKALGDEKATLIIDVNQQVFEHEKLSEYWSRKLELLNELGII